MQTLLLAAAAGLAALSLPTVSDAQSSPGSGVHAQSNQRSHHSFRDFSGGEQRRFRGDTPDGAWGYYYGDYDANRGFDSEKWNDWWHDRPDRSFPRWVQTNQNCTSDRMWWSGSGWHC